MTNIVMDLPIQIELLQQHNTTLSNHVIELGNYIDRLNSVIIFVGICISCIGVLATIIVSMSIIKLFDSNKERTKVFEDL